MAYLAGCCLVGLLTLPMLGLLSSATPAELLAGVDDPLFAAALRLSLGTSVMSLLIVLTLGTPLAWWLSWTRSARVRLLELLIDLPIVIPPAVIGVALLQTFGHTSMIGGALADVGWPLPFTPRAVVLAQVVVSAPFYVQAAAAALRKVDPDLLLVARSLGASPTEAVVRVGVPVALPGLLAGAGLAWARALGEFGATLVFAGNLRGTTQTMPLAIYTALESDVPSAVALAIALALLAIALLFTLRAGPAWLLRRRAPTLVRKVGRD